MKSKRRKSKRRILQRAVHGGLSRLRKKPAAIPPPSAIDGQILSYNGSNSDAGILRSGTAELRLPAALAEAGETDSEGEQSWVPSPIVITVTIAAVVYIAIIAWFVSQMPPQ